MYRNEKIIDIHCHILPCCDDGSSSIKESILMINEEINQNVEKIIVTPHSYSYRSIYSNYNMLKEYVNNIFLGCEVFINDVKEIVKLLDYKIIPTMNNTKFVLVEFHPNDSFEYIYNSVEYIIKNHYYPVIAHIERYNNILFTNYKKLIDLGCYFQLNFYSFENERNNMIKEKALYCLENNFISFLGSDAHGINYRKPIINSGIEKIKKLTNTNYFNNIIYNNANNCFNL